MEPYSNKKKSSINIFKTLILFIKNDLDNEYSKRFKLILIMKKQCRKCCETVSLQQRKITEMIFDSAVSMTQQSFLHLQITSRNDNYMLNTFGCQIYHDTVPLSVNMGIYIAEKRGNIDVLGVFLNANSSTSTF